MTADVASARASSPTSTPPANNTLDDPANVRRWLQSNHPKQLALLDNFEIELRLGRFSNASSRDGPGGGNTSGAGAQGGTYQYGKERRLVTSRTVELLRAIIGSTRWRNAAQVLTLLRGLGNELHAAGGYREPAIGNVVRRVMYAVRDEADRVSVPSSMGNSDMDKIDELTEEVSSKLRVAPAGKELSLASMLWAHPQHVTMKHSRQQSGDFSDRLRSDSMGSDSGLMTSASKDGSDGAMAIYPPHFYTRRDDLRQSVMEAIQEMMSELEDLHKNINEQATQHIHAGEIILTYALSKTVELFLKAAAAKKRKFSVIVCEGAPHFGGHAMAKSLAEAGIDTTVIHDAATFAIMARVNKVLLPAHAVLANGGLIAPSGSNMVALAAKQNSVPVVTVAGMFKLCPMYPHEGQDTLNDLISPSSVVDGSLMSDPVLSEVEFVNPVHDYIPPQLIDLYVTNIGGFQPSYIYRLLAEYYHSDDWEAFE
ncbi:predicted protein [Thalassiosira pseudonana CCMP1335]|uniref:Translation initiation factor eIF2B subunit beta n=1 Tax=Thalassiosira pseudonana TaxID=35128 RepID=B8C5F6_THAPS|nr:predicted protein [Thalassiosira pseudonana CCMP1335]EED91107.1 predicted protein [Thalassiosira pseudonana CCMP1335]|eukprot:g4656.t1 g4656   contig15:1478317-1479939(-)